MRITLRLLRAGSCSSGRSRRCLCSGFQLLSSRAGSLALALKPCDFHLHAAHWSWHVQYSDTEDVCCIGQSSLTSAILSPLLHT